MSNCGLSVGDKLEITEPIYDYSQDAEYPPGYIANKGDIVFVREISHGGKGGERIYVSHKNILDGAFLVYSDEYKRIKND